MSFPYRNTVKKDKNWKLDKNVRYHNTLTWKPDGLWYEIKDCLFRVGAMRWGDYIYELKVDTKCICIIEDFEDLEKFHSKYAKAFNFESTKSYLIDWKKVSKEYCGFEVKNYNKIIKQTTNYDKHLWFTMIDFSSGCIWDLNAIKSASYFRKVGKREKNKLFESED